MKKLLFWLLVILSIPAGCFMGFCSYMIHGLDLYGTAVGMVASVAGLLSLPVCIACMVLGIIRLRKGDVKKAIKTALVGVIYCAIILGALLLDEALFSVRTEKETAALHEQMYGEDWNAAPAIEGIPELYQVELNKLYVAVRDAWSGEQLTNLNVEPMSNYYGDAPLDNIGFLLMDVNGDSVDELLVGTAAQEGGTVIFCIYSDPENPFSTVDGVEGDVYYLHRSETDGIYAAEISDEDACWLLEAEEGESIVDITYQEGAPDPAGRLTLDMIPFAQYK